MKPIRLAFLAAAFALTTFSAPAHTAPASHPNIHYEGRFDSSASAPGSIGVIWQASRITLAFEGDSIELLFSAPKGQNFFDAHLNDTTHLVEIRANHPPQNTRFENLGPGPHRLTLFKRSEADAGHVHFDGIRLAPNGKLLRVEPPTYAHKFLFLGDSITAGACNEDGDTDQWEDRRTHNAAKSYAAFTAAASNADHRNISVSGMGISSGWVPKRAGEIWDRVYPKIESPHADLANWTPDVVFLNYGENDDSFTTAKNLPFPADFTDRYIQLVRDILRTYPAAQIVILRGGMTGGARSERLRQPWEAAVAQLESEDPRLTHFVFQHFSRNHPRVADARAMADELIAWLRAQPFTSRH